jgi:hypothetical protein
VTQGTGKTLGQQPAATPMQDESEGILKAGADKKWRILRLWMEGAASRYEVQLRIY